MYAIYISNHRKQATLHRADCGVVPIGYEPAYSAKWEWVLFDATGGLLRIRRQHGTAWVRKHHSPSRSLVKVRSYQHHLGLNATECQRCMR